MPEDKEKFNEKIKELKKRYGEIIKVTTEKGIFVFKKPGRIEVKKFFDTVPRSVYDASYGLCVDTVLLPSPEELMQLEETEPGYVLILSAQIQDFFLSLSQVTSQKI